MPGDGKLCGEVPLHPWPVRTTWEAFSTADAWPHAWGLLDQKLCRWHRGSCVARALQLAPRRSWWRRCVGMSQAQTDVVFPGAFGGHFWVFQVTAQAWFQSSSCGPWGLSYTHAHLLFLNDGRRLPVLAVLTEGPGQELGRPAPASHLGILRPESGGAARIRPEVLPH